MLFFPLLRICNYFFLASVLTAEVKHLEFSTKTTAAKAAYQDKRVMVEVSSCQISTSTMRNLNVAVVVVSELATAVIPYLRLTS
jgi:hypothetical protein